MFSVEGVKKGAENEVFIGFLDIFKNCQNPSNRTQGVENGMKNRPKMIEK